MMPTSASGRSASALQAGITSRQSSCCSCLGPSFQTKSAKPLTMKELGNGREKTRNVSLLLTWQGTRSVVGCMLIWEFKAGTLERRESLESQYCLTLQAQAGTDVGVSWSDVKNSSNVCTCGSLPPPCASQRLVTNAQHSYPSHHQHTG